MPGRSNLLDDMQDAMGQLPPVLQLRSRSHLCAAVAATIDMTGSVDAATWRRLVVMAVEFTELEGGS